MDSGLREQVSAESSSTYFATSNFIEKNFLKNQHNTAKIKIFLNSNFLKNQHNTAKIKSAQLKINSSAFSSTVCQYKITFKYKSSISKISSIEWPPCSSPIMGISRMVPGVPVSSRTTVLLG